MSFIVSDYCLLLVLVDSLDAYIYFLFIFLTLVKMEF